jgi:hypothetical protein
MSRVTESVLSSQTVRLHDGQAQLTIPHRSEFTDQVTIAAYADFADTDGMISRRTVLYPRDHDLKIESANGDRNLSSRRRSDDRFSRPRGGGGAASALGLAIVDKRSMRGFALMANLETNRGDSMDPFATSGAVTIRLPVLRSAIWNA